MQDPSAYFLQQYRFESTRKQQLHFRFFALIVLILLLGSIGWSSKTLSLTATVVFESVAIGSVLLLATSAQRKAIERQDALFMLLEVDPTVLEHSNRMELTFQAVQSGDLRSIQVSKTQRRNRGSDEKGFTSGKTDSQFDKSQSRRDASLSESSYQGLEDDLRPSEILVNEANARYGEKAQQRWQEAESKDIDLIESGVEKLGDLVKTDWFEKNAKDGAVQDLIDSKKADEEY
ncbi:MAG: hypothetical protein OSA21_01510 [Candidatus Poseidoniaceae archaeon]|nr:hypothetical protein [Candidatus Poseidoniaceae archaeon]